jgi:hypothetical protein
LLAAIAFLVTFLLDLARGNALATAVAYGLVAMALLIVCAMVAAAIERSVYGPGGREAYRQRHQPR